MWVVLVCIPLLCSLWYLSTTFSRNFRKNSFRGKVPNNYLTQRFKEKYTQETYDAIIIGSGLSGLITAAVLSKCGWKVLVIEQHSIVGGSTHYFKDNSFEFDTGLHYVGHPEYINEILKLIVGTNIVWDKIGTPEDNYCYDRIVIGDDDYYFPAGKNNIIRYLSQKFPHEREGIIKYFDLVELTSKNNLYFKLKIVRYKRLHHLLNYILFECHILEFIHRYVLRYFSTLGAIDFVEMTTTSSVEVIKRYITDPKLIQVLTAQFGDHGVLPQEQSFYVHAAIVNHYLEGGYYPRGGSLQIAKSIVPLIYIAGGRVLVGKKVTSIETLRKTIIGVEIDTKYKIYSDVVISTTGYSSTYQLLPKEFHFEKYPSDGISSLCLFIGLQGEHLLPQYNIWHLPEGASLDYLEDLTNEDKPLMGFISSSSAKDGSYSKRCPDKQNLSIIVFAKYSHFDKWKDCRDEEYNDFKRYLTDRILTEIFDKYFPDIRNDIIYLQLGTPLTYKHYLQRTGIYGMKLSLLENRFQMKDQLIPRSDIQGLFLSGQDIVTPGISGAISSGLITSMAVLGYGGICDLITGQNLITDLKNKKHL